MYYEILYIVGSPITEKELPEVNKKIKKIIKDLGGEILNQQDLGNRKLAYEIKKSGQVHKRGFYIALQFSFDPQQLKSFEKKIKEIPEIIRHMIVKIKPPQIKVAKKIEKPEIKEEKISLKDLEKRIDEILNI